MTIQDYLAQGRPLLFDGAMGTCYAALPGRAGDSCELAVLDHPEDIADIHRSYLEAGCMALKTDTFSLTALLAEGKDQLVEELIPAAVALAKSQAQSHGAFLFSDLGPAPQEHPDPGSLYRRQAELFLEQGVENFLVETLSNDQGIGELGEFLKKRCPGAFLLVSFAVDTQGFTRQGLSGRELLGRTAAQPQVDGVGVNCLSGPTHLLNFIGTLPPLGKPLSVMPNAGYPTVLGRRTVYGGSPQYFGQQMAQIARAGASILGGCCGTTPEHLRETAQQLAHSIPLIRREHQPAPPPPAPAPGPNHLWDKLEAGQRVVAVELDPPKNDQCDSFLQGVKTLQQAGADLVTIADCPIGRPRADSSLLACKIKRELGMEPLPHMTCRDRNLNATKALLLGLSMEGVHNVLLVTGDPIPTEDRDEVKSVFNFNSRKLARYVDTLNREELTTPFRIFGALNLNARNFAHQLEMAQEKEEAGVCGFLTQPVLSAEALDNLKLARQTLKGKLLAGIFPVVSHKNALFLNNEISGMRVCDQIIQLYEGKDRQEGEDLAVEISAEIARQVQPYCDGFYLMTPFQRVALMERIIRRLP